MNHFGPQSTSVCLIGLLIISHASLAQQAAEGTALCPSRLDIPPRPIVDVELETGDTYVNADNADLIEQGLSHLQGNVEMSRDAQQLRADEVFYHQADDNSHLEGDVNFWDEALYLHSDTADIEFDNGTGVFNNADYYLLETRGRGHADELFIDAGELTKGENVDFTTCDPASDDWSINNNVWKITAKELVMNHETDRGTGKHVVLKIKDVPVFYSPYFSFPLSAKRKSGLLSPVFGTSSSGADIQTPYYWNIAPNLDATFTPRFISDRGVVTAGEFRYLTPEMNGFVNLEYLLNDAAFNQRDRNLIQLAHQQRIFARGQLTLAYERISDTKYFEDFGSQLNSTSQRYLPRRASFSYAGSNWNIIARIESYQTVDDSINVTSKPYKRLPQIGVNYSPLQGNNRLNLAVSSSVAYFDRTDETGLVNDVAGVRTDVSPNVSYPLVGEAGYIIPRIGVRYTQYLLNDKGPFTSSPSRVIPTFSVDSGLFFDRDTRLFGSAYLHTLEPRLFYLYTPDKNQSHLPVFDSGIYNISYATLFRHDRFSGGDRVGDANQITAAVTSRLINRETGRETGFFRIAQAYRLSDQNVIRQLINPNGVLVDNGVTNSHFYSPVLAELGITFIKDLTISAELQWEPKDNFTEKLAFKAQYHSADNKVVNVAYRVRRAASGVIRRNTIDIDQTDLSLHWPMSTQWGLVGRWNYAVSERRSLDMFAGVEYDSCCYAVRAVARRFITNIDGEFNNAFFLQFELKGLAGLGQKTVDFLEQSIPGYKDGF